MLVPQLLIKWNKLSFWLEKLINITKIYLFWTGPWGPSPVLGSESAQLPEPSFKATQIIGKPYLQSKPSRHQRQWCTRTIQRTSKTHLMSINTGPQVMSIIIYDFLLKKWHSFIKFFKWWRKYIVLKKLQKLANIYQQISHV